MTKKAIYLPGLNGIRAIAALAVLISHITLNLEDFGLNPYIFGTFDDGKPRSLDLAGYGVTMFFALSGFLITYLLFKEKELAEISVKKFYVRRILRIWPLYFSYLALCIITYLIFDVYFIKSSIFYYLFFTANIPFVIGGILPFLSHFWSLAVEEQFYMFWPWLNKMKSKLLIICTVSIIVLLISLKTLLHLFVPNSILEMFIHVNRFHCMLIGSLGAMILYNNQKLIISYLTNYVVQLICWLIFLLILFNQYHLISFLDNEIITVVTTIIIIGQVTKNGPINLENKVFDYLGKISYGIYVIHPLLIFLFSKILRNVSEFNLLNYIIVYSIITASVIFLSHVSYFKFESIFLKLKKKKYTVVLSESTLKEEK